MGVSDVLSGVGGLASAFGGTTAQPSSSQSSSQSTTGYAALPANAQSAYNNYFNLVNTLGGQSPLGVPSGGFTNYNANPSSIFNSQGLQSLQAANPNTPMNPSGYIEPFNSVQQNALSQYANPNYSQANMAQYENPFQQQVTDTTVQQMQRNNAINQNNITSQMNSANPSVLGNSALGTEYALNNQLTNQNIGQAQANLGYQGYNSSIGLYNNTLQNMLNAGNTIQTQNQNVLNMANPASYTQAQYQTQPSYLQASALAPLFSAFPSSGESSSQSSAVGATPILGSGQHTQNTPIQNLGGLLTSSSGGLGSLFG